MNFIKTIALIGILILSSCSTDEPQPSCEVTSPDTFVYEVDGASTVSYSGQTARLNMVSEILSEISDVSGNADLTNLNNMYANGQGFSDQSLNESGKQLRSKTAGYQSATNKAHIQMSFDGWLEDFANNVSPAINNQTQAAPGQPGLILNRELNAKGLELDQCFAKGLIGALCLDQTVNGYLSDVKIGDAVNNTDRDPNEDNNATAMEHHWDEGYGYVYGKFGPDNVNGDLSSDQLLGKYLNKYPDHALTVFNAFKKGRQAIVDGCYDERDNQAKIIKETLSKVVALKAEGYLRDAADAVDQSADYFHALSEGYGFIFSLQFTYNEDGVPYFTHDEVNAMLSQLEAGNGLWDRTDAELIQMADDINAVSGL